jgi:hypothetical protein
MPGMHGAPKFMSMDGPEKSGPQPATGEAAASTQLRVHPAAALLRMGPPDNTTTRGDARRDGRDMSLNTLTGVHHGIHGGKMHGRHLRVDGTGMRAEHAACDAAGHALVRLQRLRRSALDVAPLAHEAAFTNLVATLVNCKVARVRRSVVAKSALRRHTRPESPPTLVVQAPRQWAPT